MAVQAQGARHECVELPSKEIRQVEGGDLIFMRGKGLDALKEGIAMRARQTLQPQLSAERINPAAGPAVAIADQDGVVGVSVLADTGMGDTLIEMTSKGFGIAAVVGPDGTLSGVVTDGDLRRNMDDLMARKAGDVASGTPVTVGPNMLAAEALAILQDRRISVLMVTDDAGAPIGVLHIHDLLRAGVA